MTKWCVVFVFAVSAYCLPARAQDNVAYIRNQLNEAEDYLTVNPAQSLALLDAVGPLQQPLELSLRWHLLLMRAAVPTDQLERILPALDVVFRYKDTPEFQRHLTSIASAAGIWLRRNNYLEQSRVSLQCAQKYASRMKQRITLLNSIGLLNRQLGDRPAAVDAFNQALTLAKHSSNTKVMAMVENNLGLLALDNDDYATAEAHFRNSLMHYQAISQRSGQISAALNLMLVSLLQNDTEQYQRLYGPTAALTANFPNQAKQALLYWLQWFAKQQQATPTADEKKQLLHAFSQQDDRTIMRLMQQQLAAFSLKVTLPSANVGLAFDRPWYNDLKSCDWPVVSAPIR